MAAVPMIRRAMIAGTRFRIYVAGLIDLCNCDTGEHAK